MKKIEILSLLFFFFCFKFWLHNELYVDLRNHNSQNFPHFFLPGIAEPFFLSFFFLMIMRQGALYFFIIRIPYLTFVLIHIEDKKGDPNMSRMWIKKRDCIVYLFLTPPLCYCFEKNRTNHPSLKRDAHTKEKRREKK